MQVLSYFPGQEVTIILESFNADGYRADGYQLPDGYILPGIKRIIKPNFTEMDNYPTNMIRLDTGLFYYKFTLPKGAAAVGSYLVDVAYYDPISTNTKQTLYQIVVTAPYGNFSTGTG